MSDVGLSVLEGVSNGVSPFTESSKHNIGLLMERKRGVPNKVYRVTTLQEDRLVFGGTNSGMYGPIVARNIYKNARRFGATIFGVRVVGDGSVAATVDIDDSATVLATLTAGYEGQDDPGDWGNDLSFTIYPAGADGGDEDNIALAIIYDGREVERFVGSTIESIVNLINGESKYVNATLGTEQAPSTTISADLTGGSYTAPVEADFQGGLAPKTGLNLFDGENIQLFANTEIFTSAFALEGRDYAAGRKGFYIANLPQNSGDTEIDDFASTLQQSGPSYIAVYREWGRSSDENGGFSSVPVFGAVLGAAYIRTPGLNQDLIFTPPGGVDAALDDINSIEDDKLSQSDLNRLIQRKTINSVVFRDGYGFFPISSRTMGTDPKYHSIHIRRQTNFYQEVIEDNLLFAAQKLYTPELAREVYVSLFAYFRGQYNLGGLENSVSLDVALQVATDRSVNPVNQDRKLFNALVEWIPTEQTESVVVRLNRNDGALITEEVT